MPVALLAVVNLSLFPYPYICTLTSLMVGFAREFSLSLATHGTHTRTHIHTHTCARTRALFLYPPRPISLSISFFLCLFLYRCLPMCLFFNLFISFFLFLSLSFFSFSLELCIFLISPCLRVSVWLTRAQRNFPRFCHYSVSLLLSGVCRRT